MLPAIAKPDWSRGPWCAWDGTSILRTGSAAALRSTVMQFARKGHPYRWILTMTTLTASAVCAGEDPELLSPAAASPDGTFTYSSVTSPMSVATTPCTPNLGASADGPIWSLPRTGGPCLDGLPTAGPCAVAFEEADVGTPFSVTASMSVEDDCSPLLRTGMHVDGSASRHAPSVKSRVSLPGRGAAIAQTDMAASGGRTLALQSPAEGISGRCSSEEDASSAANSLSFRAAALYDRYAIGHLSHLPGDPQIVNTPSVLSEAELHQDATDLLPTVHATRV